MKAYFEKNKETIKPLSFRLIFFSFCFIISLGLNYYLKNEINPSLEGIPVLLYILFAVYYVTKSELKKMLVSNPGKVSLSKFTELYEKYGYSIQLPGFVEHNADECVVAYTNDNETDRVMGTGAFRLFNRYVKIPFVFDYTKDRVIIKSKKAVIHLADLSANDLDAFNPNIANFLKLEYRLSFNQKKLKLKVSDGSNHAMRLNDQNIETIKRLLRESAF